MTALESVPELPDDLDEYLAADVDLDSEPPAPDTIDPEQAEKLMRRRRILDRREATVLAQTEAIISQARDWADAQRESIKAERTWVDRALEGWARLNERRTKVKTVKMPSGVTKLTAPTSSITLEFTDEAAFVEWADRNHPKLVDRKPTPRKGDAKSVLVHGEAIESAEPDVTLKQAIDPATGEVVPGVHFSVPTKDRFKAVPS